MYHNIGTDAAGQAVLDRQNAGLGSQDTAIDCGVPALDVEGDDQLPPQAASVKRPRVQLVEARVSRSRWGSEREFTERGRSKRLARLFKKVEEVGATRVLHVTLTYSRQNVPVREGQRVPGADGSKRDPATWFHLARDRRHVGEFIRRLRRRVGYVEYFKGAEFQTDGFIHWHLLICGRARIPIETINACWPWGFAWVTRASGEQVAYVTKGAAYAAKGSEVLPDFLNDMSSDTKLLSTSRGFYGPPEKRPASTRHGGTRDVPTIGEVRRDSSLSLRLHLRAVLDTGEMICRTIKSGDLTAFHKRIEMLGYDLILVGDNLKSGTVAWVGWRAGGGGGAAPPRSLDREHDCGGVMWWDLWRSINSP